jgi:hypothetical protein
MPKGFFPDGLVSNGPPMNKKINDIKLLCCIRRGRAPFVFLWHGICSLLGSNTRFKKKREYFSDKKGMKENTGKGEENANVYLFHEPWGKKS